MRARMSAAMHHELFLLSEFAVGMLSWQIHVPTQLLHHDRRACELRTSRNELCALSSNGNQI